MYIKSNLFTVDIKEPIELMSDGTLSNPSLSMQKFSVHGQWGIVRIKKSAIVAQLTPTDKMADYYRAIARWIGSHFNPQIDEIVGNSLDSITGLMGAVEEIISEDDMKQRIYARVLLELPVPEGPLN